MEKPLVELKDMIMLLRIQKHDILNHLQVISGFLQLNKLNMAQDYLKQAIEEIQQQGKALKIQSPELVGVLYHYQVEGERLGTAVTIEITNEILELVNAEKLAGILKEFFEYTFKHLPRGIDIMVEFLEEQGKSKMCKLELIQSAITKDISKELENLKSFIDSANIAYYNQSENSWIIAFEIE